MTELIRILLDNAMKYAIGEPVITVGETQPISYRNGNRADKRVVSQIFWSLLRVDSSRNRTAVADWGSIAQISENKRCSVKPELLSAQIPLWLQQDKIKSSYVFSL